MTDIGPAFNEVLKKYDTHIDTSRRKRSKTTDEFLKEAYTINTHISSLTHYLRTIRQSYLSTSKPPHRHHLSRTNSLQSPTTPKIHHHLTDAQRDDIDAHSKQNLRNLNAAIRQLADAEQLRQDTIRQVAQSKRARQGLGALGRWAAGGVLGGGRDKKSPEEEVEEARQNTIKMHRESVVWYLRRKLEEAGEVQRGMMEVRLEREVERSRSVLYKTRGSMAASGSSMPGVESPVTGGGMNGYGDGGVGTGGWGGGRGGKAAQMEEEDRREIERQLSPEQLQLFAQENNEMLKMYEDQLDQIRTAERSMIEISELQTTLAANLDIQSAQIDQLAADSFNTRENVGGGNKELKRAAERKSTARMVFFASCGLSLFLIGWDLLI
ncbi:t-SNARE [Lasallia pustulata]|uniref:t-SNARE n=1 Tax=Lasallia pustulata TaxID=136370 RepID=A0A1W5DD15_9LECA|nr:t-SNARE [Lasallia pustulata]